MITCVCVCVCMRVCNCVYTCVLACVFGPNKRWCDEVANDLDVFGIEDEWY